MSFHKGSALQGTRSGTMRLNRRMSVLLVDAGTAHKSQVLYICLHAPRTNDRCSVYVKSLFWTPWDSILPHHSKFSHDHHDFFHPTRPVWFHRSLSFSMQRPPSGADVLTRQERFVEQAIMIPANPREFLSPSPSSGALRALRALRAERGEGAHRGGSPGKRGGRCPAFQPTNHEGG